MNVFLFWMKVTLIYVSMICGMLIVFPNNKDFIIFLSNYVSPLAVITILSIIVDAVEEKKKGDKKDE